MEPISASRPFSETSKSLIHWIDQKSEFPERRLNYPALNEANYVYTLVDGRRDLNAFWFSQNNNAICDMECVHRFRRAFILGRHELTRCCLLWRCFLKSISCWYLSLSSKVVGNKCSVWTSLEKSFSEKAHSTELAPHVPVFCLKNMCAQLIKQTTWLKPTVPFIF